MAMNDAPHIGQADSSDFKLVAPVQSLKNAKKLMRVLHTKTGAIVFDEIDLFPVPLQAADLNHRIFPVPGKLQRIGEQVDPDLLEHGAVAPHLGQGVDFPIDLPALKFRLHFFQHFLHQPIHGEPGLPHFGAAHAGENKQIVDQCAHALC